MPLLSSDDEVRSASTTSNRARQSRTSHSVGTTVIEIRCTIHWRFSAFSVGLRSVLDQQWSVLFKREVSAQASPLWMDRHFVFRVRMRIMQRCKHRDVEMRSGSRISASTLAACTSRSVKHLYVGERTYMDAIWIRLDQSSRSNSGGILRRIANSSSKSAWVAVTFDCVVHFFHRNVRCVARKAR